MEYSPADIQLIREKFGIKSKKRARFALEYLAKDGNGRQAAIAAGYPTHTAHSEACRLLKLSTIQEAMAWAKQGDDTQSGIINELRNVTERAAINKQFAPAVKALELRGRHIGMWESNQPDGTNVTFIINGLDSPPPRAIEGEVVQDSAESSHSEGWDEGDNEVGVRKSITYEG